jgi:8-oxo-dGTP pyrophosphatase MutT (NUDIX family)
MILKETNKGPLVYFIKRSQRNGDPWSGHMAFPGGKLDPIDKSLQAAAERECLEEVGLDLNCCGEFLGELPPIRPVYRGSDFGLIVYAFVYQLREGMGEQFQFSDEVEAGDWIPLSYFNNAINLKHKRFYIGTREEEFPCFDHKLGAIWGLSFRMLENLFKVLEGVPLTNGPVSLEHWLSYEKNS